MQENYYFFAILIKNRVPLFPRGMKGTKIFWITQEKKQRPLAYYAKFSKFIVYRGGQLFVSFT